MGIFKETLEESKELKGNVREIADTYGEIVDHVNDMASLSIQIDKRNENIDKRTRSPVTLFDSKGKPLSKPSIGDPGNIGFNIGNPDLNPGLVDPAGIRRANEDYFRRLRIENTGRDTPVNPNAGLINGPSGPSDSRFTTSASSGSGGGGGSSENVDTRTGGTNNTPPPVNPGQGYLPPGGKSLTETLNGPLAVVARTVNESGNRTVKAIEALANLIKSDGGSDIRRAKF